ILFVQLIEIGQHFIDFALRAAHGQKTVRAENVVHHKHQDEQSEQDGPVVLQKQREFFRGVHLFSFAAPTWWLRASISQKFSRTGQNSRPSFLNIARTCSPMEAPRAAINSATSRQARMPSFSGIWPRMVSPALSSPPSAILSARINCPMYLNPTGVWWTVCPWDFAAASIIWVVATLRAAGMFHLRVSTR